MIGLTIPGPQVLDGSVLSGALQGLDEEFTLAEDTTNLFSKER